VLRSGRFWLRAWLTFLAGMLVWGGLTVVFWMDSTRNINALSIVANIGMAAAGAQAALTMRKADPKDPT
jgi:hypothetical protein